MQIEKNYNFIAGPVHVNGNHWTLFFANLQKKKMFYLDSAPSLSRNYEKRCSMYFNNWKEFWGSKYKDENWQFIYLNEQHQTDGYNCGVFVCYYFYLLINDDETEILQKNERIDDFRKFIHEIINNNKQ